MGIDTMTLEFLLDARKKGVKFKDTITLGRQDLLVEYTDIENLFYLYDIPFTDKTITEFYRKSKQFAEPLLEYLGAKTCKSIDYSDFEGASIVHDLNNPISYELKGQFDTVIDGGTLEHVFNFPQAIKNCMELVKVGGHFISITPTNNYLGHGFYQFSPELLFRIFSEENGFKVTKMIYCEQNRDNLWYEVLDPKVISHRVEAMSMYHCSLMLLAEKIKNANIFEKIPQQSDYADEWTHKPDKGNSINRLNFWGGNTTSSKKGLLARIKMFLKQPFKRIKEFLFKKLILQPKGLLPDKNYFVPYKKPK